MSKVGNNRVAAAEEPKILRAEDFIRGGMRFHVAYHTVGLQKYSQHTHEGFLEFFYVIDGECAHWFHGRTRTLPAGSLVLVRERDVHMACAAKTQTHFVNIAFPTSLAREAASFMEAPGWVVELDNPGKPLEVLLNKKEGSAFNSRIQTALKSFPDRDEALRRLLLDVLSRILPTPNLRERQKPHRTKTVVSVPTWLTELCKTLDDPNAAAAGIQDFQDRANCSPEHLARSFRKFLGVTPTDYLNGRRLDHAARQLASSDEKILAIAYDSGFEQPGYFYRLFRRRFGLTPRQYRMRAKELVQS